MRINIKLHNKQGVHNIRPCLIENVGVTALMFSPSTIVQYKNNKCGNVVYILRILKFPHSFPIKINCINAKWCLIIRIQYVINHYGTKPWVLLDPNRDLPADQSGMATGLVLYGESPVTTLCFMNAVSVEEDISGTNSEEVPYIFYSGVDSFITYNSVPYPLGFWLVDTSEGWAIVLIRVCIQA